MLTSEAIVVVVNDRFYPRDTTFLGGPSLNFR